MKIYFKDKKLNKEFITNGYVKLKLFNNDEIKSIENFGKKIKKLGKPHRDNVMNFYTNGPTGLDYNAFFSSLIDTKVREILIGYEFFNTTIAQKPKKSESLPWHYDLSIYDEKKYGRPIAIWAGFKPTNAKNGNFILIPKSHKLATPYYPFPSDLNNFIYNLYDCNRLIKEKAIEIPLKKGEVIIHDQGLFHSSAPNRSFFKDRLAYKLLLVPSKVNEFSFSYFNTEDKTISTFQIPKEKLINNAGEILGQLYTNPKGFNLISKHKVSISDNNSIPYDKLIEILEEPIKELKPLEIMSKAFSEVKINQ